MRSRSNLYRFFCIKCLRHFEFWPFKRHQDACLASKAQVVPLNSRIRAKEAKR